MSQLIREPRRGTLASGADGTPPGLRSRALGLLGGAVGTIAIALVLVVIIGETWTHGVMLTRGNVAIVGSFVAVPMLIGTLSAFSLLGGVVDLSIGSMVGFSAAVFASLNGHGWNPWLSAGTALALSLVFGAVNVLAIVGCGADPIATTLGMLTVLRGLCTVIVPPAGSIISLQVRLYDFTNRGAGPVPLIFLLTLLLAVLATCVVVLTRAGRHLRAVGGDPRAAARAGISVPRLRTIALLLSAFGAAAGGIVYAGQLGSASNVLGTGLEFQVYAALMIGGYSILRGGVGNPAGGVMGLLVVAGVSNILDVKAVNPYYVNVVVGTLLLAAVLLDRLRGGDAYE